MLHKLLDDKLTNLKEFIKSYIETYQTCLNTTNPNFLFQLVKSSTDMQDFYIISFMNKTEEKNEQGDDGMEEENIKIQ